MKRDNDLFGADELRLIVQNMNTTKESFNDRYTLEELIQIYRIQLKSEWDYYPDQWTQRQVNDALKGIVPDWDDDGKPVYTKYGTKVRRPHFRIDVEVPFSSYSSEKKNNKVIHQIKRWINNTLKKEWAYIPFQDDNNDTCSSQKTTIALELLNS